MAGRFKKLYFRVLSRTLNPLTLRAARAGRGPFSLVRHVGRKSGRVYETPVVLATVPDGFVAELTYGPDVQWYRNIVAAGGCTVVVRGREHRIDRIAPVTTEQGLAAFGPASRVVLRLLRRREFRLLSESYIPSGSV